MTCARSMPCSSPGPSFKVTDELPIEATLLAPGVRGRGDRIARGIFLPLILLLFLLLLIFYILFSPSMVDGDSMLPALADGDRLLLTKTYTKPSRGDIVAFYEDATMNEKNRMLKRIVAIPGDTVEIRDGVTTINRTVETGDYIPDPMITAVVGPLVVPDGTVFVMGDNRAISLDSRFLGPVPLERVVGKVAFVWAPIHRIRFPR